MSFVAKKLNCALCAAAIVGMATMSLCTKQMPYSNHGVDAVSGMASGSRIVRITSPANGEVVNRGDSVFFQAALGDTLGDSAGESWRGTVSFYANNVLIAKDSIPPYACAWKASTSGTAVLIASAWSAAGFAGADTAKVTVKDGFISLASPVDYQMFTPHDTIVVSALPSPYSQHAVKNVRFYRDSTLLATISAPPYSYRLIHPEKGTFVIKAVALDAKNKSDTAIAHVTVRSIAPTVSLTYPNSGSVFFMGDSVPITVDTYDSSSSIKRVILYKDGKEYLSSTKSLSEQVFVWCDARIGTFTFTARAFTIDGDTGTSMSVLLTRRDGFIVLTSSQVDSQGFYQGCPLRLSGVPVEKQYHVIKSLKIYRNDRLVAEPAPGNNGQYDYVWENAVAGTFAFKAIAVDTKGKVDTSNIITVSVMNQPLSVGLTIGSAEGDSAAALKRSDTLKIGVQAQSGPCGTVKWIKVYENGRLLATSYSSTFTYERSLSTTPLGTYSYYAVAGDNLGATARSATYSVSVVSKIPGISLTSPAEGASFNPKDTVVAAASLTDFVAVAYVRFTVDSFTTVCDSFAPYGAAFANLSAGSHYVRAVAHTPSGLEYASPYRYFTVQNADSEPFTVVLTSPQDSSVFLSTGTILCAATASAVSDSVAYVKFYRDSTLIATDYSAPFACSWSKPPKGTFLIQAVAGDIRGRLATSNTARIVVR